MRWIWKQLDRLLARWRGAEDSRTPLSLFLRNLSRWMAAIFLISPLAWAVQRVPEWQVKRATSKYGTLRPGDAASQMATIESEMRKTVIQILGGIFAIGALYLTYRRTLVTEQGHITDRYTKAIEQLGATKTSDDGKSVPNVEVRLGAIYALERIAFDSPRDHWTIMEVLTAYVRENAPLPVTEPTEEENKKAIAKGPATEVQAILTVLARRLRDKKREREGHKLNLRKTDLRGANFLGGNLQHAVFSHARLEGANFFSAHVEQANFSNSIANGANFQYAHIEQSRFSDAYLQGSYFIRADVEEVVFYAAHLERAHFAHAHAKGAIFNDASLEGATFRQAYLTCARFQGAKGLTSEKISEADEWQNASYDDGLAQQLGLAPANGIAAPKKQDFAPREVL